jgi:hypothetical protein
MRFRCQVLLIFTLSAANAGGVYPKSIFPLITTISAYIEKKKTFVIGLRVTFPMKVCFVETNV